MLSVFLASVAVAASRFKVPPALPTLMADLGVSMVAGGWLMSIFSLAIIALAIPTTFLLARLGPKVTGLVALGFNLAGSVAGALAPNSGALLVARTVEGVGLALMAVVAPSVISLWFRPEVRGLPMGIWTTWVPLGSVIMFNVAQPLETALGWRAIWWFGALLTLCAALVYALVVTRPPQFEQHAPEPPALAASDAIHRLLNPSLWLLTLAFALFAFAVFAYNTWAPSYLTATLNLQPAPANLYSSLMFLAAIPANILAGWLLDRFRNRTLLLSTGFLVTSVLLYWSFRLGNLRVVAPYMIALGFISNLLPPAFFTLAPETMVRRRSSAAPTTDLPVVGNAARASMAPETMVRRRSPAAPTTDPPMDGSTTRDRVAPETMTRFGSVGASKVGTNAVGPVGVSLALAAILAGSNVGALAGPPVLGSILSVGPWTWGSICLAIVTILGTIVTLLVAHIMTLRD